MFVNIESCKIVADLRGELIEFLGATNLDAAGLTFGNVYLVTLRGIGTQRGNHYHKLSQEIFCLLQGSANFTFKNQLTGECKEFILSADGSEYFKISIDCNVLHTITAASDFVLVACFSSAVYNPQNEDKYSE
ncbi:MAG: WxcM-like domain-containing protein [Chitinophagales bacterium]|nr:WxcM-like domain-containing protein [Chitinophagales bacterium]